jgi:hypothetical protein
VTTTAGTSSVAVTTTTAGTSSIAVTTTTVVERTVAGGTAITPTMTIAGSITGGRVHIGRRKPGDLAAVVQPPSGTVTFVFTDIEGSTQLWESAPEVMRPDDPTANADDGPGCA